MQRRERKEMIFVEWRQEHECGRKNQNLLESSFLMKPSLPHLSIASNYLLFGRSAGPESNSSGVTSEDHWLCKNNLDKELKRYGPLAQDSRGNSLGAQS